jgi:L-glyceraldehyde 3-phosphate reductase
MTYVPADDRYEHMRYRRSGRSGLQLPAVSLGLWQNFGDDLKGAVIRVARHAAAR